MTYILALVAIAIFCFALWSRLKGGWKSTHQRIVGGFIFAYGIYLSTLTGSYTILAMPGFGGIGLGAGAGAAIGLGTYLFTGTVGVATGGVGIAIGALTMMAIGGSVGGVSSATSGFGLKTITYPLVSPIVWVPMLILGAYFLIGLKKSRDKAALAQLSHNDSELDVTPEVGKN